MSLENEQAKLLRKAALERLLPDVRRQMNERPDLPWDDLLDCLGRWAAFMNAMPPDPARKLGSGTADEMFP